MPNGHHDIFDEEWFRLWKELEDLYFNRPPFEERNEAPRLRLHNQLYLSYCDTSALSEPSAIL